jgi:hypothetical protein
MSGTSPSLAGSDPEEEKGLGGDDGRVGGSLEADGGRRGASESRLRLVGLAFEFCRAVSDGFSGKKSQDVPSGR